MVVDFGGPGDIVHEEVGYKFSLTTESDIASRIESILTELASNRELLGRLRQRGMAYARERLTWDAKAQTTTQVMNFGCRAGSETNTPSTEGVNAVSTT